MYWYILNPSYKRCTNIMSSVRVRKENKGHYSPSTNDVRSVTLAAFLRPAGRLSPILSNLSRNDRPPFLDFALKIKRFINKAQLNKKKQENNFWLSPKIQILILSTIYSLSFFISSESVCILHV